MEESRGEKCCTEPADTRPLPPPPTVPISLSEGIWTIVEPPAPVPRACKWTSAPVLEMEGFREQGQSWGTQWRTSAAVIESLAVTSDLCETFSRALLGSLMCIAKTSQQTLPAESFWAGLEPVHSTELSSISHHNNKINFLSSPAGFIVVVALVSSHSPNWCT